MNRPLVLLPLVLVLFALPLHAQKQPSTTVIAPAGGGATQGSTSRAPTAIATIDVSGIPSWEIQGSLANIVITEALGTGAIMTGIGWDVTIETVDPSWLSEASIYFDNSDQAAGFLLAPGAGDDLPGIMSYSSGGIVDLSSAGVGDITILADGLLYLQFFESFDDTSVAPDALWIAGTLDIEYVDAPVLPDLGVAKDDDVDPVVAGANLVYTVTAENFGPTADATAVVVSDTLPAPVSWVSDDCGAGPPAGQLLTWNIGALANGATATCNITVLVDPGATGSLSNDVSIDGAEDDPNSANDTDNETTAVNQKADLEVLKSDDVDPVLASADLVYTVTAENLGLSHATGVVVADTLPVDVAWVSDDCGAGPPAGQLLTWNVGALASGAGTVACTVTVTVDPAAVGPLSNVADISGSETDPNGSNDQAIESTVVGREADLEMSKTHAAVEPVLVGSAVTYTLTVTSLGPSTATDVTVTDTLPAEVDWIGDDCGAGPPVGQDWTWNVGTLNPGESAVCALDVLVVGNGLIENTAVASALEADPVSGNDSSTIGLLAAFAIDIPTLGPFSLGALALLLLGAAAGVLWRDRRR